jgi:hypothetical protein
MTKLKFFDPKIDRKSLMESYDFGYLSRMKEIFGITDVWATYSWGFSEEREKEDYEFLLSKVENFKKLGLKLHAYIQGPTVVYKDFPNVDWYCKDHKGRDIWYHRGRKMVCMNNPHFVEFVVKKIQKTKGLGFDAIFIDNIVMGQLPLPVFIDKFPFIFAGCYCKYCQEKYLHDTEYSIPLDFEQDKVSTKRYLRWRARCVTEFLRSLAVVTHAQGMLFGSNSYDPHFLPQYTYGVVSKELDTFQDYHLFESLSFPNKTGSKNNQYIEKISKRLKKPVFVVSYKYGIGIDGQYSQDDWDVLYSEGSREKLHLAIKGSEYVTHNTWHNLRVNTVQKPTTNIPFPHHHSTEVRTARKFKNIFKFGPIKILLKEYYNPIVRITMEYKFARKTVSTIAYLTMLIDRKKP